MCRPWGSSLCSLGALALSAALFGVACDRPSPTAPETRGRNGSGLSVDEAGGARASEANVDGNQLPTAVFRTRPPADEEGVIAGGAEVNVTFNLCQSTDPDPGDELRFSFDFDGDGVVDQLGHCRATRKYEVAAFASECLTAVACVTDRQPEHKVCQTYQVCAKGRTREPAGTGGPEVFFEQPISGDFTPLASRDSYAFAAEVGTAVTFELDTVSEETAYWMNGCVSTTNRWADCLPHQTKDRVACSFATPGNFGCPRRTTILPPNPGGLYYVIVGGLRFTSSPGRYVGVVRTSSGVSSLIQVVNNGEGPPSIDP